MPATFEFVTLDPSTGAEIARHPSTDATFRSTLVSGRFVSLSTQGPEPLQVVGED
jgi:hypothetical protein